MRLTACSYLHCDQETGENCVIALYALFTKLYTGDQINDDESGEDAARMDEN
jgi:hypothetical protein